MASLNRVFLIGNLTRDPELRYTPQGTAVATLGLAVNRSFKDKATGEWKKDVCFINIITWGALAESCNQYLQKGRPVFVEGRLQSRTWQDSQGNNRSVIEVRADRVQFLDSKPKSGPEADLGRDPAEGMVQPAAEESKEEGHS